MYCTDAFEVWAVAPSYNRMGFILLKPSSGFKFSRTSSRNCLYSSTFVDRPRRNTDLLMQWPMAPYTVVEIFLLFLAWYSG